ncbi:hypothetical protein C1752_10476 [Acaryochloris thomasi RCC1774]|uniref:Uncharacterized protein n=1 Tax=Acaryochloris thomasi RCC1774 TaxID=1764569 RepID=A0A2W1J940_9CYAN|nr:hypothetical protein [Acaryochloris thomasi]PZD70626.1 hypothetical protein C1752_10476 [Acaryochloris thomasi RCC1774]
MSFLDEKVPKYSRAFSQVIVPLKQDAIALNESLLAPDAHHRATAAGWQQYQQQLNPSQPKTAVVDWRLLKGFTGYTRDDLIGFCLDEGLPPISGKLTPHEARTFRDVVLCNWAMVEGYFSEHWQAREALADLRRMLPWTVAERKLFEEWASVCQGNAAGQASRFYGQATA